MADLEVLCSKAQPYHIAMDPKLLEAVISGDERSLDQLLQQYFSPRASREEIAITIPEDARTQKVTSLLGVTPDGSTALHIVASQGHLELAKKICHRERSLLETSNTMLDTPLHHAARTGRDEIVSLIIQLAKEGCIEARRVLRATNMDKANALHEATKHNHASVATTLIEEDAELASMLNDAGMSPLYLAIVTGSLNVAKALLQSSSWERASPVSYAGPNKKTVLHAAVLLSPEIIPDMLKWKPMLTRCVDSSGRTPLHYAASDGHSATVKLLLEHDPSTAFLLDADGLFPIHVAARMGNVSTVDQILQQCPKTSELLEREGKNFLHVAFKDRKLDAVKKIISKRPDLKKLLNDRDNEGNTPLHTAVKNSDQQSVHFLLRDKNININVMNYDGFTPLDLAYAKLDVELHFPLNADDYIAACLALTKAEFGPRQFHASKRIELSGNKVQRKSSSATRKKKKEKSSSYVNKEMEKHHKISQNFVVVSVLVATVTFAAAFTVPGGYIADDHPGRGTAVLAKYDAFYWFLASDFAAFVSSTTATFLFAFTEALVIDQHARTLGLCLAVGALFVAIGGMFCAFVSGIVASLPPASNIFNIIITFSIFWCIILSLALFLMVRQRSVLRHFQVLETVRQREGIKQLLFPWYLYLYLVLVVGVFWPSAVQL